MKYQIEVAKDLLKEYECIIEQLKESKVVNIDWYKGNKCFYIGEMCDEWYDKKLTKEDCVILSELFSKMANFYDDLDKYKKEMSFEEEYKNNNKVKQEIIKSIPPIPLYTITKDWFFGNKLIKSISEDVSDDLLYIDRNLKNNGYELIDGKYYCNLDSGEVIVITLSKFEQ